MPVTFYNDHYDLLLQQDAFFARKVSPGAKDLREKLNRLWLEETHDMPVTAEGVRLHRFLTGRGRYGRRFAPRFWEEAQPARARELMLIACKKWHVAKRLLAAVHDQTGLHTVEFAFHEASCPMPDLGGIESSLEKRNRHRRALVSLLFDAYGTDRLALCVDLSALDMMRDLADGNLRARVLEIECEYSDAYLQGHAYRIGLASDKTAPETLAKVLPTLRNEIAFDHEQLASAQFGPVSHISENAPPHETAATLATFFRMPGALVSEMLQSNNLFQD